MAENINDKKIFSLFEVMNSIQKTLAERYRSSYWIKAEMSKLNHYSHSGHCYPELIEKHNEKVIAQVRATLWKDDYNYINNNFLNLLREPLKDGIKILFLAKISFDPSYGLTLKIIDIDPAYTLGDLEKEKLDTIKKIEIEGIFKKNKALQIPLLPQRVAIVSVETSKGYADFLKILQSNSWGYKFFTFLFPSLLQGEKAIDSIINQLQRIKKVQTHFDVVAIIRGGGGDVGLSCYNSYKLVKEIALFPIPVITGIGHATNETVVEMISFCNGITPTKIAGYLLQKFHNFSVPLKKAAEKITARPARIISDEKLKFTTEIKLFRSLTERIVTENKSCIKEQVNSLLLQSVFHLKNQNNILVNIKEEIKRSAVVHVGSGKQEIRQMALNMKKDVISRLRRGKLMIKQNTRSIVNSSQTILKAKNQCIYQAYHGLCDKACSHFETLNNGLKNAEKNINNMSPGNVLKRGYSITYSNGKLVKSLQDVNAGDTLDTIIFEGNIYSIVTKKQNE